MFNTNETILKWEEARDRGDELDLSELRAVEAKMSARQLLNKTEEEGGKGEEEATRRAEIHVRERSRKATSDVRELTERTTTRKDSSTRVLRSPTSPSVPFKRKASSFNLGSSKTKSIKPPTPVAFPPDAASSLKSSVPSILQTTSAVKNQSFHALSGDRRPAGRKSTGTRVKSSSTVGDGQYFRNLSHQNNAYKLRRQEPAPNMSQISNLLPVTQLPAMHDVALNLPTCPRPLQLARDHMQEILVEPTDGDLARQQELSPALRGTFWPTSGSLGPQSERSQLPPYQQSFHPVFDSPLPPSEGLRFLRHEGWYLHHQWGELVPCLKLGTKLIGHVKLIGLSSHLCTYILHTKVGSILSMTFEQEDAENLQIYMSFEHQVIAAGAMEPYDYMNAREEFYRLVSFLNEQSAVAAVWRHESVPWIMVAYSSQAPAFLAKGFPTVSGGLAFIVCKKVPWSNRSLSAGRIQPPTRSGDMSLEYGINDLNMNTHMATRSDPDFAIQIRVDDSPEPMTGIDSIALRAHVDETKIMRDPRRAKGTNESSSSKVQPDLGKKKTDNRSFEKKYSITYDELTRIAPSIESQSENRKINRQKVSFYLAFGKDKEPEEAELRLWLSTFTRTPAYMIYSTSEGEISWEKYKDSLHSGDHLGAILIHDDFLMAAFRVMKRLANQIRRDHIRIFRVSLERPLHDSAPLHFKRIFPSGLVILISEATMIDHAARTAELLAWFASKTATKPNYRLFLRPHPQDYLRDLCEADISEEDRASHRESLALLESLTAPPATTSPPFTSPYDDTESSNCVFTRLDLPIFSNGDESSSLVTRNTKKIAERDGKLVSYFCGWSFDHVSHFRKFVAISPDVPEETRKRNSHIDFLTLASFEEVYGIQTNLAKLNMPKDLPLTPLVKHSALT